MRAQPPALRVATPRQLCHIIFRIGLMCVAIMHSQLIRPLMKQPDEGGPPGLLDCQTVTERAHTCRYLKPPEHAATNCPCIYLPRMQCVHSVHGNMCAWHGRPAGWSDLPQLRAPSRVTCSAPYCVCAEPSVHLNTSCLARATAETARLVGRSGKVPERQDAGVHSLRHQRVHTGHASLGCTRVRSPRAAACCTAYAARLECHEAC